MDELQRLAQMSSPVKISNKAAKTPKRGAVRKKRRGINKGGILSRASPLVFMVYPKMFVSV